MKPIMAIPAQGALQTSGEMIGNGNDDDNGDGSIVLVGDNNEDGNDGPGSIVFVGNYKGYNNKSKEHEENANHVSS